MSDEKKNMFDEKNMSDEEDESNEKRIKLIRNTIVALGLEKEYSDPSELSYQDVLKLLPIYEEYVNYMNSKTNAERPAENKDMVLCPQCNKSFVIYVTRRVKSSDEAPSVFEVCYKECGYERLKHV